MHCINQSTQTVYEQGTFRDRARTESDKREFIEAVCRETPFDSRSTVNEPGQTPFNNHQPECSLDCLIKN